MYETSSKTIEKSLETCGVYIGPIRGDSMMPLIREGTDRVVIVPVTRPLRKYDVPLYVREGRYVLHRIVSVGRDGYVIRGDNRIYNERDVTDDMIIGMLSGVMRGEDELSVESPKYRRYSRRIVLRYFPRIIRMKLCGLLAWFRIHILRQSARK